MTTQTAAANRTYLLVKSTAYLMFALGLVLSITHIYGLFRGWGAGVVTAAAVPVFIDGFQLVGRALRGESFASEIRKTGLWLQMFGAAVSLFANVYAGQNKGEKIAGAIFVIGYITIEAVGEKIRPASDDSAAKAAAAAAAAQQAAAQAAAAAAAKAAADKAAAEAAAKQAEIDAAAKAAARKAALSQRAKNAAATRARNKAAAKAQTIETIDPTDALTDTRAYL